jgi:DNA-binding HxlR family transcriptional regulator
MASLLARFIRRSPPKVEYALTELGRALGPSIESLINWAFLKCEISGGTPQER